MQHVLPVCERGVSSSVDILPLWGWSALQAIPNCINGKVVIVLNASESFFLGRSHNIAIDDQARGRVVIEGRYAKNVRHWAN